MREAEVLVRLVASGICRTDIDFYDHWYDGNEALVLGHEGAGGAGKVGRGGSDRCRTIVAAPGHA